MKISILAILLVNFTLSVFAQNSTNIGDNKTANAKKISEEKSSYNGREYRLIRYSDGTSKLFDMYDNWFQFQTEYVVNEYTGSMTDTPIGIDAYISEYNEVRPIAVDIKHQKYHLVLTDELSLNLNGQGTNKVLVFTAPSGIKYKVIAYDYMLKKLLLCFRNYLIPGNKSEIWSYFTECINNNGNSFRIYGPNGNSLDDVRNRSFFTLTDNEKHKGGFYDPTTKKMYYLDGAYGEGRSSLYSDSGRTLQAWSLSEGSSNISTLSDDVIMIDCLPSDTITQFIKNTNIAEIHYSNGDYIKYSLLKNGEIFDCSVHRPEGIFTIKIENGKPIAKYTYTSGLFKGYVHVIDNLKYNHFKRLLGFSNLCNGSLFCLEGGAHFYDPKTMKELRYEYGSLYDPSSKKYVVLGDKKRQELQQENREKAEKEKEMQSLYQKYGKKYVDSLFKNNKILVGTPENLIRNHTNSSVVRENQTTRVYEIKGVLGTWASTVYVNKATKKVSSVTYRSY